ncbi:MAG TPA: M28 family metallopeptidase [Solirubrobacteraceae bacterium]|nr:M28 family metallopeptidase [Solirubrobacteraceae bacterium]
MTRCRRSPAALLAASLLTCGALLAWGCGTESERDGMTARAQAPAPAPGTPGTASAPGLAPLATARRFNEVAAFALLREQVLRYGWRPAGSPALRRLAVRLRALMPRGRFESIPGHPRLRNVVGTVPGRKPAIVVAAHYDVEAEPKGFVGANDGAAGTAAVVTLARAFARLKRPRGARELHFVLFDGEEEPAGCAPFEACGIRGSRAYAARHHRAIGDLVLLDYIAEKHGMSFPRELNSDPRLWARLRSAAKDVGVGSIFPAGTAGTAIIDDHVPFIERGVRAIDVIDFDYPQRDTLQDDLDAVAERSLDAVGEAVHLLVARLRRSG